MYNFHDGLAGRRNTLTTGFGCDWYGPVSSAVFGALIWVVLNCLQSVLFEFGSYHEADMQPNETLAEHIWAY
jgi:hypothetical protein